MSCDNKLVLKNISKKYDDFLALDNFNYTFEPGIYGLLGPNGAGKSTLMNIITNNLRASEGAIDYNGIDVSKQSEKYRSLLGVVPQQQTLYPYYTLERFLYYMASLKGLSKKEAKEQISEIVKIVNLENVLKKKLGGFSGGMKQRALIAQALLGNPKILVLDEATAGLDPKERIRIRNILSSIAFDKIVIFATHVVLDIEFIAKEVLLLSNGKIINSGSIQNLCEKLEDKVFVIKTDEGKLSSLGSEYKIVNISKDEQFVYVRVVSDIIPINYVYEKVKPSLEDLYLYYFE